MVPLPRLIRQNAKGRDVVALKRALIKAGFRPYKSDRSLLFDDELVDELKAFQRDRGLDDDGVLGDDTYGALSSFYDAYGRFLLTRTVVAPTVKAPRQRVIDAAQLGFRNRDSIAYSQDDDRWDGIDNMRTPPSFPKAADCSSFVTWCYWTVFGSGADIINDEDWADGFTGTQADNGRKVARADARPADLVLYGDPEGADAHVAMYVGNGNVISHGGQAGPKLLDIDYRDDVSQFRSYV